MHAAFFLSLLPLASAHYHLNYPYWRGDSLALSATNTSISQWFYPCAGIGQDQSANNRTDWPVGGGSLVFAGSHPWALTYVSLALGNVVNSFNISLVKGFNQTGNGTFCFKHIGQTTLAALNIQAGTNASIQVVQISAETGSSLYNCADITFSSTAQLLSDDQCKNATGVSGVEIVNAGSSGSNSSSSTNGTGSGSGNATKAAAGRDAVSVGVLLAAVGMGIAAAV